MRLTIAQRTALERIADYIEKEGKPVWAQDGSTGFEITYKLKGVRRNVLMALEKKGAVSIKRTRSGAGYYVGTNYEITGTRPGMAAIGRSR